MLSGLREHSSTWTRTDSDGGCYGWSSSLRLQRDPTTTLPLRDLEIRTQASIAGIFPERLPGLNEDLTLATLQALWRGWLLGGTAAESQPDSEGLARSIEWLIPGPATTRKRTHRSRMPDPMLQNHNCVAALQHRLAYNLTMSLPANRQSDGPLASTRKAADPRRGARVCLAGLVVATLLGRQ